MNYLSDKNKRTAIIGTLLFHVVVILVLIFTVLTPPIPPRPEIGVQVNLGNSDVGMGEKQPEIPKDNVSTPKPTPQTVENPDKVVTQDQEQTIKVNDQPKSQTKPQPKTEPVEEPKKVDDRFVFKKNNKSTTGGSEGNDDKLGDKGRIGGDPNAQNYVGDKGNGISVSLKGRQTKSLPRPAYDSDQQGTVIVKVWVNKSGKVINAEVQMKGTTTADSRLHRLAINAAKRALFDANPEAPEVQTGTITYDFILLN